MVRAVTAAGGEVTGVRVNEDTFSIQIRDVANRIHSFWKSELRELDKEWGRSPMPSYREALSAAELDDVVAFLASLRGDGQLMAATACLLLLLAQAAGRPPRASRAPGPSRTTG